MISLQNLLTDNFLVLRGPLLRLNLLLNKISVTSSVTFPSVEWGMNECVEDGGDPLKRVSDESG